MIDVRVFTNRAFSAASGALALTFFALFGSLFVLTQYLQLVHGYSTLAAGIMALPFALAMGAVSPVSSVLAQRFGARPYRACRAGNDGRRPVVAQQCHRHHRLPPPRNSYRPYGRRHGPDNGPSVRVDHERPSSGAGGSGQRHQRHRPRGRRRPRRGCRRQYRLSRLPLPVALGGLPAAASRAARSSVAAADQVAAHAGPHAAVVATAAHRAFASGMSDGLQVAAIFALAGVIAAGWALPRRRREALAPIDRVEQPTGTATSLVAA